MPLDVSIIIVNYNTELILDDCLKTVFEKTNQQNFEVIVVDNSSQSASLDKLIATYPQVRFIFSDENLGFGRANNLAAKTAMGKYLFFLNPDTLLVNDAIDILFQYMESHPRVGISGGNLYNIQMQPILSYHTVDFMKREYRFLFNRETKPGFNTQNIPKEVSVIMGADLMIRKSIFEQLEGFDPDFFMYFEEVELCNRAYQAGYKIVSVPQAQIIHLEGAAAENKTDELKKWSYQEHWYSKLVYFHKTKGNFRTELLYQIIKLKGNLALLLCSIKNNQKKKEYWHQKQEVLQNVRQRFGAYKQRKRTNA